MGSVATGEPGTNAQVTNSGDENNAILNFVIPRGATGTAGTPQVLATVDDADQPSSAGGALTFSDTPLVSGTAITHQAGAADVVIQQPGIYQVSFHSAVTSDAVTAIPGTVQARLYLNGTQVAGASASHTFAATNEEANLTFGAAIRVETVPGTLQVQASRAGYTFRELALTVIRLGDAV